MKILHCLLAAVAANFTALAFATTTPQVSSNGYFSLSLKADGTVWAWGNNYNGQLGLGDKTSRNVPVQVSNLSDMVAIAAGGFGNNDSFSLALKRDGTLWTWGGDFFRHGRIYIHTSPTLYRYLSDVVAIAAGYQHSLALKRDGSLWAWGIDRYGQLGLGDGDRDSVRTGPVLVTSLSDVVAISAGFQHSLALKRDGTVWAWGNNDSGDLGLGDLINRNLPTQVIGVSDVVAIVAGFHHNLVLKRDGTLWAWGYNREGQLGLGDTVDRYSPVQITSLNNIVAISGDFYHLALQRDGTLWAWGLNDDGALGIGDTVDRYSPVQVSTLNDVVAISGGYLHSLALKRDGSLWAWGHNGEGELGLGVNDAGRLVPAQVEAASHIASSLSSGVLDLGSIARGIAHAADEAFAVTSSASSMTMDFDQADIASSDSLATYAPGNCASGAISAADVPCHFTVKSKASGRIGLQRSLLTIPAESTFARTVMIPVAANVTGAQLFSETRNPYRYRINSLMDIIDRAFVYTNKGDADVMINSIALSGNPSFSLLNDSCSLVTLAPGTSCTVMVRWSSTSNDALAANLDVASSDPVNSVKRVALYIGKAPKLIITGTPLNLGTIAVGSFADGALTLTNNGRKTLHIDSITQPSSQFTLKAIIGTCMNLLPSHTSCMLPVRFWPTSVGAKQTSIRIISDDPATPTRFIEVDGTGV